jgi:hypothetical protein
MLKEFIKKAIKHSFYRECIIYEKLFSINFELINYPRLDCFHSNDLSNFVKINNYENKNFVDLFSNLIKEKKEVKKINIKEVNSIMSSKSKSSGYSFETLYLFGKNIYLDRNNKWDFDECISHVLYKKNVLDMYHYNWNDRYAWSNSDGSHHFAVAVFHAENENKIYIIDANVTIKYIDEHIANKILNIYSVFVINSKNENSLRECFKKEEIYIFNIAHGNDSLVVFDKSNRNIISYVRILELIDDKKILDFNKYLQNRLDCQISTNKKYL